MGVGAGVYLYILALRWPVQGVLKGDSDRQVLSHLWNWYTSLNQSPFSFISRKTDDYELVIMLLV